MARSSLLKGFKCPKSIKCEYLELKSNYGKFSAEPFETGFGTTVGNTLRRILLSSIQGYAITAIKITSYRTDEKSVSVPCIISNEFETIPETVEDTLEVINNLKKVRFRLSNDVEQGIFSYRWSGNTEIRSNDLERTGQVSILNNGLHIMTLMEKADIEFEIQMDLGRGYVAAEVNEKYINEINVIPIDANFSPVRKVKYTIEPTRVGQRNDYEKLTLEIWTDGTIHPEDALAEAAKIAKDHFAVFINFDESNMSFEDELDENDERIRQVLNTPVEDMELSVRSYNCLKNANIRTIGELTRRTEDDITKTRNFGKKSLQEIKEKLKEWNLVLGITDINVLKNAILNGNIPQVGVGVTESETKGH
ncbi:MAG: DNA-directed RNA polymerase subunit alpha [Treponema sp.]|jgi:DNA-directed RNA polymerase subunit alpha|nr:DNA-directed RNA polymerase subunit alpha [Treponema sp.]